MNDFDARAVVMIKALKTVVTRYYEATGDSRMLLVALAGVSARLIVDSGGPEALEIFDEHLSSAIELILEEQGNAKTKHGES